MKKIIAVATSALLLASCVSVHSPKPALVTGLMSQKVQVLQLDQSVRAILGARDKDDLIIRVGVDGTITLFGTPGKDFKVEERKADKLIDEGAANKFTVTTFKAKKNALRSSPCILISGDGWEMWDPSPPCPIQ